MILTEVILRLREKCPIFNKRVGGTAKFSRATELEETAIGVPCCFVMPQGTQAQPRLHDDNTTTMVTERVAIIVCVDNTHDRSRGSGVSAQEALRVIEQQIYTALVGWRPLLLNRNILQVALDPDNPMAGNPEFIEMAYGDMPESNAGTFSYNDATHISMSTSRLWHQFEFSIPYPMLGESEEVSVSTLKEIYTSWYDKVGYAHIDDYELTSATPEEALGAVNNGDNV